MNFKHKTDKSKYLWKIPCEIDSSGIVASESTLYNNFQTEDVRHEILTSPTDASDNIMDDARISD